MAEGGLREGVNEVAVAEDESVGEQRGDGLADTDVLHEILRVHVVRVAVGVGEAVGASEGLGVWVGGLGVTERVGVHRKDRVGDGVREPDSERVPVRVEAEMLAGDAVKLIVRVGLSVGVQVGEGERVGREGVVVRDREGLAVQVEVAVAVGVGEAERLRAAVTVPVRVRLGECVGEAESEPVRGRDRVGVRDPGESVCLGEKLLDPDGDGDGDVDRDPGERVVVGVEALAVRRLGVGVAVAGVAVVTVRLRLPTVAVAERVEIVKHVGVAVRLAVRLIVWLGEAVPLCVCEWLPEAVNVGVTDRGLGLMEGVGV